MTTPPTDSGMPHGRRRYRRERCRCGTCRAANAAVRRRLYRQHGYGQHPLVDAEPARRHVQALKAAGLGRTRIAELSGVAEQTIAALTGGVPSQRLGPSRRILATTEERILSVPLDAKPAGGVPIDATGAHRRLQALVAIGWTQHLLAERLGRTNRTLNHFMTSERLYVTTVQRITALYDELWDTAPPEAEKQDRVAAQRARGYARKQGWVPPLAWDDDTIDDPTAEPEGVASGRVHHGRLPCGDELLWLLQHDDRRLVADRFHVRVDAVDVAVKRAEQAAATAAAEAKNLENEQETAA